MRDYYENTPVSTAVSVSAPGYIVAGGNTSGVTKDTQNHYELQNYTTIVHGKHSVKFGTRLRYTGASLGYQLGAPLAGGLAPIIAASLAEAFPGQVWPLALYVALLAVVSLVCVLRLAETSRKDISGAE